MSDLAATNCGCGDDRNGCGCDSGNTGLFNLGGSSCSCILWIIILLECCGNGINTNGDSCWIIILLLLLCNGGCGNNGCGC